MADDLDPIDIGIQLDRAEDAGLIDTDVAAQLRELVKQRVTRLARNARKRRAREAKRQEAERRANLARRVADGRLGLPTASTVRPLDVATVRSNVDRLLREVEARPDHG